MEMECILLVSITLWSDKLDLVYKVDGHLPDTDIHVPN